MDFDPLSMYSSSVQGDGDRCFSYVQTTSSSGSNEKRCGLGNIDNEDAHLIPLHHLDLPRISLQLSEDPLLVLLRLFSPEEQMNFAESSQEVDLKFDESTIFQQKNISEELLDSALAWFKKNNSRFDSRKKLAHVPYLSSGLRKSSMSEYNSWLSTIISSDLPWIKDTEIKSVLIKEASLRLSENCGRSAHPEIVRKIRIPGIEEFLESPGFIKLKEPSLTNDNLGLKTWGSSLVLSNRLVDAERKGNTYLESPVLELGSGTGLVGMMSHILGYETILTDLKEIVPNLQYNTELNGLSAEVHELDWTNPDSFIKKYGNITFKTIILSDPVYSPQHPYWIKNMIDKFLDNSPQSRVLIQLPLRRNYFNERNLLWKLLDDNYKEIEMIKEKGNDDFGEIEFCFKVFIRK